MEKISESRPEFSCQNHPLFVLEGADAVGKTTQIELLVEKIEAAGYRVEKLRFPRYQEPGCYFVDRYLSGQYGPLEEVDPYQASTFFALDRYDFFKNLDFKDGSSQPSSPEILEPEFEETIFVSDRYVGSNLAYQGARLAADQRQDFFDWCLDLEFQKMNLWRPTLNIILTLDIQTKEELLESRKKTSKPDENPDDIHTPKDYQRKVMAVYQELCQKYPDNFVAIDCLDQTGQLLEPPVIAAKVYQLIEPYLSNN